MNKFIYTVLILLIYFPAYAQKNSLFNSIKYVNKIDRFIFVGNQLPQQDLIELAAQARIAKMTMVLSGFVDQSSAGLEHTKIKISEINQDCCEANGPGWIIYPQLFEKFKIKEVPTFVLSKRTLNSQFDFAKVTGVMSVQNALKYIYAEAVNYQIKEDARSAFNEFKNE